MQNYKRICSGIGDGRGNEQPLMQSMNTLWIWEHNRVAKKLQKLRPEWDDEKLYQEARRVVVAEFQHIIYNEWLPIILGNCTLLPLPISTLKASG